MDYPDCRFTCSPKFPELSFSSDVSISSIWILDESQDGELIATVSIIGTQGTLNARNDEIAKLVLDFIKTEPIFEGITVSYHSVAVRSKGKLSKMEKRRRRKKLRQQQQNTP